ncbi:MAG: hypothetical protein IJ679_10535 [Lachnospiraceae bacterium]|nr:hypothetical protein [Lachnospiraceae bacterium]
MQQKRPKEQLAQLGKRVLLAVKKELYFEMPYLSYAVGSMTDCMDISTRAMGTDGWTARFHPHYLFETYLSRPGRLNRVYMHMLVHNLLLHPAAECRPRRLFDVKGRDRGCAILTEDSYPAEEYLRDVWNLSCDIAVESIIDSMDVDCLRMVESDFRNHWYDKLRKQIRTFSAQRLFDYFLVHPISGEDFVRLEQEFWMDDHRFWEWSPKGDEDSPKVPEEIQYAPMANLPLKEVWEKVAKAVQGELENSGSKRNDEAGRLRWSLLLTHTQRGDFSALLEKYMVRREVASVDPDAFDPAYYHYGMERYGNMPLIEELEGREEKRLETLVIAIDTSASTRKRQVQRFLTETVGILRQKSYFFEQVRIHIIECDERVQKDVEIRRVEQIEEYESQFEAVGGYGTDYRPVFSYVEDLRKEGRLRSLKGLLYFTDGYGIYPERATDFDTAFVFANGEDFDDTKVPDWAIKVYV